MNTEKNLSIVSPLPRITINRDFGSLSISIPARKSIIMIFMIAWLGGWTCAGPAVATSLFSGKLPPSALAFTSFWLCGWAFGECAVGYGVAWMLAGVERVTVNGDVLTIRREIGGVGRTRRFDINAISNLRLSQPWMRSPANSFRSHDPRTVAFNYGLRTYWIGKGGVDEAESEAIFDALGESLRGHP